MKKKWKIIIVSIFMLPMLWLSGCSCSEVERTDSGQNSNVTYTVSFYTDSTDIFNISPIKVRKNGRITNKPTNPVKNGYVFIGWYKDLQLTELWRFESDVVVQDMTLYAKWEKRIY